MLKATLNNSANLSLSNPVEEICEVSIAGGTSGGVGSLRITSSVFAPALLVLKVIFAEGLQNPNKRGLLSFIMDTVRARKCILFICTLELLARIIPSIKRSLQTEQLGLNSQQARDFFLCHHVQIGSEAHPAPCLIGTGGYYLEG